MQLAWDGKACRVWWENPKDRDCPEHQGIHGKTLLCSIEMGRHCYVLQRLDLLPCMCSCAVTPKSREGIRTDCRKPGQQGLNSIHLTWASAAGCFDRGNELTGFTKCLNFFDKSRNCCFLNDSVLWGQRYLTSLQREANIPGEAIVLCCLHSISCRHIGRTCSTNGCEKYKQKFSQEVSRERCHLIDLNVNEVIILRWVLGKKGEKIWIHVIRGRVQ